MNKVVTVGFPASVNADSANRAHSCSDRYSGRVNNAESGINYGAKRVIIGCLATKPRYWQGHNGHTG